ncbi:MAG: hypothetical protein ALECFALPRED_004957 [Alectoria fallacina]|uniref:Enolase n=1 Tax=Alectoria fallacina TaxID=1903189 RepID=A0A8H3FUZ6_9LECA|nr:MAG: hypothetical protein ALECFALPRED_004957 [Alectoria fallacina]
MISAVSAAQRLDSRGKPTVQVRVTTDKGQFQALVPSGASKGDYEAIELRDNNASAYGGKGVETALDVGTDLKKIDALLREVDGSDDKSRLGANAILGISMACARAGAAAQGVPLYEFLRKESGSKKPYVIPVPFFNVLNGGVHSGNTMAFQECMIAPVGARSMAQAVQMGSEVYQELKKVLTKAFGPTATGIGDEGGFAPPISQPHEALDLLVTAVENCGYTGKVKFAMDPASSEFYNGGEYDLGFKGKTSEKYTGEKLGDLYHQLLDKYPIILLEDPFAQDDWPSWTAFNKTCPVELVGDDLLATNVDRIEEAKEKGACNSLLLKINQIGTITEALSAAKLAYELGWSVFVSHRSGETTDDFIADLTVGLRTGHLKSGSPCRGERVAKYNRLMDIEDEIKASGAEVIYAGAELRTIHSG